MVQLALRRTALLAGFVTAAAAVHASAQQPAAPPPGGATFAPDAGAPAPDFTLPGATRYGLLKDAVKLSDFRGQTVVLAFFPKARTRG
jgi:thioredoxin-dependent peroxiredoxin